MRYWLKFGRRGGGGEVTEHLAVFDTPEELDIALAFAFAYEPDGDPEFHLLASGGPGNPEGRETPTEADQRAWEAFKGAAATSRLARVPSAADQSELLERLDAMVNQRVLDMRIAARSRRRAERAVCRYAFLFGFALSGGAAVWWVMGMFG